MTRAKPKKDPPLPPIRTFTYASADKPGSYVRVHGREAKTARDRDALIDIILAARSMLDDRTDWRAKAQALEKRIAAMQPVVDAAVTVRGYADETGDTHRCVDAEHPEGECVDCAFLHAVDAYLASTKETANG